MEILSQVNLSATTGNTFSQLFTLKNPDKTARDLTGCSFSGHVAKHAGALDVIETELPDNPVYNFIPLIVAVESATEGTYRLFMSSESTSQLKEGKYVYSVTMTDPYGTKTQVLQGLFFVDFGLELS